MNRGYLFWQLWQPCMHHTWEDIKCNLPNLIAQFVNIYSFVELCACWTILLSIGFSYFFILFHKVNCIANSVDIYSFAGSMVFLYPLDSLFILRECLIAFLHVLNYMNSAYLHITFRFVEATRFTYYSGGS